ncbi:MAG: DUF106 domain-containing protein [Candidatus Aenigmarchaeota archaeon]|nr:DUF106 domain-containing protein [Candidatus Aenigmarchaeota archaeon]
MGILTSLLPFHPAMSLLVVSCVVLFLINLSYKLLINQGEAKRIKARMNDLRKKLDESKDDKKKTSEIFSEIMRENGTLMRMSLKPMIFSGVIVLLIIPFVTEDFGDRFAELRDGRGNVTLSGSTYQVGLVGGTLEVSDGTPFDCVLPCRHAFAGGLWNVEKEGDAKIKFARIVAFPPFSLPFTGEDIGWVGWYLMASIPLALLMRKLLKIYV